MSLTRLLVVCLVSALVPLASGGTSSAQATAIPLCRALERLEPGSRVPVVVSGVYAVDHFYDPDELACRLDVDPSSCVEFSPELSVPAGFEALHRQALRVQATFQGFLHGPQLDSRIADPSLPVTARLAAANGSRYCANHYPTKLFVESILEFGPVPDEVAWGPKTTERPLSVGHPSPLEMALPRYPLPAISLRLEGVVILAVTVSAGEVVLVQVQFGDPVLVDEAVANIRTWRFHSDVNTSFAVEYDYRLEKRSVEQGTEPSLRFRLPSYLQVVGPSNGW